MKSMATETVIEPKNVRKVLLSVLLQRSTLGFVTMHNAPRAIIENIKDIPLVIFFSRFDSLILSPMNINAIPIRATLMCQGN